LSLPKTKVVIKRPAGRGCSASGWVVIPSHTPACAAIAPKSMPQATRVWPEQDRMAHHHQALVAHGAAHDLQDIRGGQTAQHQVNGDADKEQHQRHQARST
jgi:hypothetical protein